MLNWIQKMFAENAPLQVRRIERGTANQGIEIVGRLREVFAVSWSDLLGQMIESPRISHRRRMERRRGQRRCL